MFDIGWSEMAIIMLLALIIIGPKDLPRVARTVGQWVRKGRMLARDFQNSLEDMARETELDDVKKEIENVGRTDLKKAVENSIDPKGELAKAFDASNADKGNDTVGKTLNGSVKAEAKVDQGAISAPPAPTAKPVSGKKAAAKPATKKAGAAPKKRATAKKPASATRKPASSAGKTTAAKARAPKKRAAKPASSTKPGSGDPSSADDSSGGAAMAAKSS
ncbi:MAG: Sec-independent protein translocase protein TatB [Geminicoccaceae bacterium]